MTAHEFVLHLAIGIPAGVLASNATEWFVHKYFLHGLGRVKNTFWAFHWHEHHNLVRKHGGYDPDYEQPLTGGWNGQTKEVAALIASVIVLIPTAFLVPGFFLGAAYSSLNYYIKHRKSHLDPEWARQNLPWHYDHHMGIDQDCNWCVTRPWFDWVMGTRVPYVGTEREARDVERARKRAEATAERAPANEESLPMAA